MRSLSSCLVITSSLLLFTLGGCTGGTSGDGVRCANGDAFCLISCDLGCSSTGCAINEIAENQRLRFQFSQAVNPASVHASSFSIRTISGQSPDGQFVVSGDTITFEPRVRVTNGVSTFGFLRGESYVFTMAGGPVSGSQSIRSVSGDGLQREFSCTAVATLGIVDEDGLPPSSSLVSPTATSEVPVDVTIVLRFSELIDTTPLAGPLTAGSPIRYQLRRLRTVGSLTECDTSSLPILIEGLPRVTPERSGNRDVSVVSVKPNINLPSGACVEVIVTSDVRDLAGVPAVPATYRFFTATGTIGTLEYTETFANAQRQDLITSSSVWSNGARAGFIGNSGLHGSFDASVGTNLGGGVFQFDTGNTVIPATRTTSGNNETVSDGKFYFTDFIVPTSTTVRFVGLVPAQIYVRGRAQVDGRVESNGVAMTTFNARVLTPPALPGQDGGVGGAGGGRGGRGGQRCTGTGPTSSGGVILNNGEPGVDLRLPAGHAYLGTQTNTGGRGSALFPTHGTTTTLALAPTTYTLGLVYNGNVAAGGGGGGFATIGAPGTVIDQPINEIRGPDSTPGVAFVFTYPPPSPPPGYQSLTHFLIGGSGGGGGGSHPALAQLPGVTPPADVWKPGAGGSGGGGAVAIRAGGDLNIGPGAVLSVRGGDGAVFPQTPGNSAPPLFGIPAPGGGGSGGSFVLQCGGNLRIDGRIDAGGGPGGRYNNISSSAGANSLEVRSVGGQGSAGNYRLEAFGTLQMNNSASVPVYVPATHSGSLTDRDNVTGARSLWRTSGLVFPPTWLRYELEVDVFGDGTVIRLYSDDPNVAGSIGPANLSTEPVQLKVQAAIVSTTTGLPVGNSIGPWRFFVNEVGHGGENINVDSGTGFRFELLFNRGAFPNAIVRRCSVYARG